MMAAVLQYTVLVGTRGPGVHDTHNQPTPPHADSTPQMGISLFEAAQSDTKTSRRPAGGPCFVHRLIAISS